MMSWALVEGAASSRSDHFSGLAPLVFVPAPGGDGDETGCEQGELRRGTGRRPS